MSMLKLVHSIPVRKYENLKDLYESKFLDVKTCRLVVFSIQLLGYLLAYHIA